MKRVRRQCDFHQRPDQPAKRSHSSWRGIAAVEMALVLPVFVAMTLGIVEFGRAMMVSQLVTNAARDGARTGSRRGATEAEVITAVNAFLSDSLSVQPEDISIDVTVAAGPGNGPPGTLQNAAPGDQCTVNVTVPFATVALVPGDFLGNSKLRGFCSMRREW